MRVNKKRFIDFVIVLIFGLVCLRMLFSLSAIINTTAPDFPSYYYATQDLLNHKNPYTDKMIPNIFIYPAVTSLLYLPFIGLPYQIAQAIFVILSTLAVPGIVYLSVKLIYKKFSWRHLLIFTSLAFLSFPTKFTLGMGQINLIALFCLLLAYYLYTERKLIDSGVLLSVAFLAKPILCFMLLFFLLQKAWKVISISIVSLLFSLGASLMLYGINSEMFYFSEMVPKLISGVGGREVYYNQGMLGFISRLTADFALRKIASSLLTGGLLLTTYHLFLKKKISTNMQFAFLITLLPIIHTLSWQHYFVVLIFPYILATKMLLEKKKYLFLCVLAFSYLLISITIKDPSNINYLPFSLVLSHTFFGAIILLFILFYCTI